MSPRFFQKIDALTILVGVLMSAVFYFWKGQAPAVSVLLGAALGMLNFVAQRYITAQMVRAAATGERAVLPTPLLFLLKYAGVGLALFVLLGVERVDVIGFTAGFFSYLVAIVAMGGFGAALPPSDPSAASPAPDSQMD